jgi:hypothetical protein
MRISLIHSDRMTREVLCRLLASKMGAEVVGFSNLENLLHSDMKYDVFVVYNMFGRTKMDRWEGVKWIRNLKPDAYIVSMNYKRFFDRKESPGADASTFSAEDDVNGLVKFITTHKREEQTPNPPDGENVSTQESKPHVDSRRRL